MRPSKLPPNVHASILAAYQQGASTSKLGKQYNVNAGSIYYLVKKSNLKPRNASEAQRHYAIDEDYFSEINTPEQAYFLGLLYADGNNDPSRHVVRLVLTATDKPLLEQCASLIFKEYRPLNYRPGGPFIENGKTYIRKPSYCLTIASKKVSDDLSHLGVVKRKSLILKFPNFLPPNLLRHFIRGYFDGDGCLTIRKDKQGQLSFIGTKAFCVDLACLLHNILNVHFSVISGKKKNRKANGIYQIFCTGRLQCLSILDWMYEDASIKLDRKYHKYLHLPVTPSGETGHVPSFDNVA